MKRLIILGAVYATLATGLSANPVSEKLATAGAVAKTTISKSAAWYWEHKLVTIPATLLGAATLVYAAKKAGLCQKVKVLKNHVK